MTKKLNLVANGFTRRKDLDFTDDGSSFRGYDYDGMPVTYCKYEDKYYISVRRDYLENSFTFEDWRETEESKLEDEFNGVTEVDIDKLIDNCKKIKAKVKELNEQVESEAIDTEPIVEAIREEICCTQEALEYFERNYAWWEASEYELTSSMRYIRSTVNTIRSAKEQIRKIEKGELKTISLRQYAQMLEKHGYVIISPTDFYLREFEERLEKQNERRLG